MIKLSLFFLAAWLGAGFGLEDIRCPPNWTKYKDFCYKGVKIETTQSIAHKVCQIEGAELVSIHDKEEEKFVGATFLDEKFTNAWIGLVVVPCCGQISERVKNWTDGTPVDYTEPLNAGNKDASRKGGQDKSLSTVITRVDKTATIWQVGSIVNKAGFICKRKGLPVGWVPPEIIPCICWGINCTWGIQRGGISTPGQVGPTEPTEPRGPTTPIGGMDTTPKQAPVTQSKEVPTTTTTKPVVTTNPVVTTPRPTGTPAPTPEPTKPVIPPKPIKCEDGWTPYTDKKFNIVTKCFRFPQNLDKNDKKTWNDWKIYCEKQGATLASMANKDEEDAVIATINPKSKRRAMTGGKISAWIGLNRVNDTQKQDPKLNWWWLDQTPFEWNHWESKTTPPEPDNINDRCARILVNLDDSYSWWGESCQESTWGVCQKSGYAF